MEKIKPSQKKDTFIFLSVTAPIAIISYFYGIKKTAIIGMIFGIILMFVLKVIYDYIYHSRFSINEKGIILNWHFNKKIFTWDELKVDMLALNKDQIKIIFSNNGVKIISIKVDYLNNISLSKLIKKYCPSDHNLYIEFEKYAKANNVHF